MSPEIIQYVASTAGDDQIGRTSLRGDVRARNRNRAAPLNGLGVSLELGCEEFLSRTKSIPDVRLLAISKLLRVSPFGKIERG